MFPRKVVKEGRRDSRLVRRDKGTMEASRVLVTRTILVATTVASVSGSRGDKEIEDWEDKEVPAESSIVYPM